MRLRFVPDWTMLYVSWEFDGTTWTKCFTLNAFTLLCTCADGSAAVTEGTTCPEVGKGLESAGVDENAESPLDALPEEFLEAVELNTEVTRGVLEGSTPGGSSLRSGTL